MTAIFDAVGQVYADSGQVTDHDVGQLLATPSRGGERKP